MYNAGVIKLHNFNLRHFRCNVYLTKYKKNSVMSVLRQEQKLGLCGVHYYATTY